MLGFLVLALLTITVTTTTTLLPSDLSSIPRYDHKDLANVPLNQFCGIFRDSSPGLAFNKTVSIVNGYKRKPVEQPIREAFQQAGLQCWY
jgi:hypothetical protein